MSPTKGCHVCFIIPDVWLNIHPDHRNLIKQQFQLILRNSTPTYLLKLLAHFFLQSGAEPVGALVEVVSVAGLGENENLGVLVGIWDSTPLLVLVGSSSPATS